VLQRRVQEETLIGIYPELIGAEGDHHCSLRVLQEGIFPVTDPQEETGERFMGPAAPDELIGLGLFTVGTRLIVGCLDLSDVRFRQLGDKRRNHFDLSLIGPGQELISLSHNSCSFLVKQLEHQGLYIRYSLDGGDIVPHHLIPVLFHNVDLRGTVQRLDGLRSHVPDGDACDQAEHQKRGRRAVKAEKSALGFSGARTDEEHKLALFVL